MKKRSVVHTCVRTGVMGLLVVVLAASFVPGALATTAGEGLEAEGEDASSADEGPAPADSTAVFEKSEVVYGTLSADGEAQAIYIVNRFDVTSAGTIVDAGDYSSVQNLTDDTELVYEDGTTTFEASEGTLYYQGYAQRTDLPWDIQITYELDGRQVEAEDLAGADGELRVHVATTPNDDVDSAFYDSFLLQVTFTLPGGVASGIEAEGATVAASGEDTTVAFTVLPGNDGDLTLSAQVSDFFMDGIQLAALPYSSDFDMPDTTELVDGMTELAEGVGELAEGTEELADGTAQLADGAESLAAGSATFSAGLDELDGSSEDLVQASAQIQGALDQMADALAGADFSQLDELSGLSELADTLVQLADGLDELQAQAATLQAGYATALGALDSYLSAIPDGTLSESDLAELYAAVGTDNAALNELVETYEAAQAAKAVYASVQEAFDGADALLGEIAAEDGALATESAALRQIASALAGASGDDVSSQLEQLSALAEGLSALADQYSQFDEGLQSYAEGVGQVASGYSQIAEGTGELADGVGELSSGTDELADGVEELDESTSTLPDEMSNQIDEMMADYDFPAFDPVSFADADNEAVTAVQFVLVTEAIEAVEEEEPEQDEEEQGILDRLLALFS